MGKMSRYYKGKLEDLLPMVKGFNPVQVENNKQGQGIKQKRKYFKRGFNLSNKKKKERKL